MSPIKSVKVILLLSPCRPKATTISQNENSLLTGYDQKAYRLVVTDSKNQIVWDSKKVNSALSHGIEYAGRPLQPTTRYGWNVTVWDNTGKLSTTNSWFETRSPSRINPLQKQGCM